MEGQIAKTPMVIKEGITTSLKSGKTQQFTVVSLLVRNRKSIEKPKVILVEYFSIRLP